MWKIKINENAEFLLICFKTSIREFFHGFLTDCTTKPCTMYQLPSGINPLTRCIVPWTLNTVLLWLCSIAWNVKPTLWYFYIYMAIFRLTDNTFLFLLLWCKDLFICLMYDITYIIQNKFDIHLYFPLKRTSQVDRWLQLKGVSSCRGWW